MNSDEQRDAANEVARRARILVPAGRIPAWAYAQARQDLARGVETGEGVKRS